MPLAELSPKVSIIIAAYNSEIFLQQAVESAINQTWKNIEILIIDDGSVDNTYLIANSFSSDKIKVFQQDNKGQCAATNLGIFNSTGDYIQFLDADDFLDINKISNQMNLLPLVTPNTVLVSKWAHFNSENQEININEFPSKKSYTPLEWLNDLWRNGMMPNSGYLIPKSVIESSGLYAEGLTTNNDFEYFTKIALNSDSVVVSEKSLCYYRVVLNSLSQQLSIESQFSVLYARLLGCRYLLKAFPSNEKSKETAFFGLWYFISTYRDYYPFLIICCDEIQKNLKLKYSLLFKNKKMKIICSLIGLKNLVRILYVQNKCKILFLGTR